MLNSGTVGIIMPAYNAARHIQDTIERLPDSTWKLVHTLWIINDGSTDTTATIVKSLTEGNPRIKLVSFPRNHGYGTAVQTGMFLCKKDGCEWGVCLHADGQYSPESIHPFLSYMDSHGIDILQGSRILSGTALSGGMPLYKFCANRALTFFENMVFGLRMTDYHSGFLFYGQTALQRIPFYRFSSSFDFDLEVIAWAVANGFRIAEQPIPTRYADEVSYVQPIGYGIRVLRVMLKYLMRGYCS